MPSVNSKRNANDHSTRRERRNAKRNQTQESELNIEAQLEARYNKIIFGPLHPRGEKQAKYVKYMNSKRLVFAKGPAGTGKTFVSTSWAVEQLEAQKIERIVITRPMVGCDEQTGFLPGDLMEKYKPWLGPFFDVLEGKMGKKKVESYIKFGGIVLADLMTLRGSTLRNAVIILDEAQNTTKGQMKMFLTRIGEGSKVIIQGDVEQSDLPDGVVNGFADALERFGNSSISGLVEFDVEDITRDPIVTEVVLAYRK